MQKHNYTVDALRFIAALMVVLFHLSQAIPVQENWYRHLVVHGSLGVAIFFVVSGYCIALSAYNSANFKDFLSRRLFRIFPAYWVSLGVVLCAVCFQKLYIGFNSVAVLPRDVGSVLAIITLATKPFSKITTINWVYWSLTCELLFYCSVTLMLLFNKAKLIYLLIGFSLLAALVPAQHTGVLFFLDQWPAFGLGISIFYLFNIKDKLSGLCFICLLAINLFGLFNSSVNNTEYKVAGIITFAIIIMGNYYRMVPNFVTLLGRYSYSVYLIHIPVGVYILALFENKIIQKNPALNFAYDLTVYLVVTGLAWLIYNHIEVPAIAYGRKFAQKYFNANAKKHSG
ncbi:acyltransferase family protein [Mucilaginibacter dorajii]|nr:acyltransferase [Mucilaginibacter dorajii]MCS3732771.1 peptidoglycan/LPS O-acetylase OafA/YrhL [Mucilaginibacter dorajii]